MFTLSITGPEIVVMFALIVIDIVTGVINAYIKGEISSTAMREGAVHKISEIIIVIVCCLCEFMQHEFGIGVDVPTAVAACLFICITEIVSIVENLAKINPAMQDWPIVKQFMMLGEKND